jgi:putative transposase
VTEGYDVAKLVSKGVKKRKKKTRRAMLDIGWGELRRQLDYKCEWSGIKFVKVARNMATDQTCHKCRTENKMPDNTSKYVCAGCGNETTRQANTAWLLISEVTRTAEGDSAAGRDVPPRKRKREKPVPKTPIRENRKNV